MIQKASRKDVSIKIDLSAPSGGGKTMSGLKLAYGLTKSKDWDKVCLVDTENGSGSLYSNLGLYNVVNLEPEFSPQKYINAIEECEKYGIEALVIDSFSHVWTYLLEVQSKMDGNSYTNWAKINPLYDALKNKILQSPMHIITTNRRKQDYVLQMNEHGKQVPRKVGMKSIQREGWDYEVTIAFEIDEGYATATKDRTQLFGIGGDPFMITEETGELIKNWCRSDASQNEALFKEASLKISDITNVDDLKVIYRQYPMLKDNEDFVALIKDRNNNLTKKEVA